jgi:hypothetical protein
LRLPSFIVRRWALLLAVFLAASAVGVEPAFAAWTKVADWEMNEGPNATTMHDRSGHNRDGTIGSTVETGVVVRGATGYRWPADTGVEDPQRLVTVASSALNPRRDAFAVTLRLKTSAEDQNIIQKGQAHTAGGMWKIEMVNGRVICSFKGSAGRVAVGSTVTVSNHVWHTVRCERHRRAVTISVDGRAPRRQAGRSGKIANSWALSIGGKAICNPSHNVSCQYYVGLLDRVVVRRK